MDLIIEIWRDINGWFSYSSNLKQKTLFMTGNLDDWLRNMLGLFCFCITNILVNKWPKNFGSAA
jgi:hypothetical protein